MSARSDIRRLTALEQQACHETAQHFADDLHQSPVDREAIERLELNLAVPVLAAKITLAEPDGGIIEVDDGNRWQKSVALLDNIFFCCRMSAGMEEYAVVEYFPAQGRNEIWNRGGNAIEVLRAFIREQRQALEIWTEDMTAQVKDFLGEKYPDLNLHFITAGSLTELAPSGCGRQ